MTYPEDRVLVAVINRRRDLRCAMDEHWYRIPVRRAPSSIEAEYVAFFLSRAFGAENGAVRYFCRLQGIELVYRRWLLPGEADHARADDRYYRLALGDLIEKRPPILNTSRRIVTFIRTPWEQFARARTIDDLYRPPDAT